MNEEEMLRRLNALETRLKELTALIEIDGQFHKLTTPLTSTAWDGDAFSTTAKTVIDLSAVFTGVPAGIKAVLVAVYLRDAASAGGDYHLILAPNNTATKGFYFPCGGLANDKFAGSGALIPCNSDGDIFYQIVASGAGSMDIYMEVWGYVV